MYFLFVSQGLSLQQAHKLNLQFYVPVHLNFFKCLSTLFINSAVCVVDCPCTVFSVNFILSLNQSMSMSINFLFFRQPSVMKRIMQCCGLNGGLFWLSMLLFEYGLLPTLSMLLTLLFGSESGTRQFVWSWLQPALSCIFGTIWVIPLFFLSKVINNLWFQVGISSKLMNGSPVKITNHLKSYIFSGYS